MPQSKKLINNLALGLKECARCERTLPLTNFHKEKRRNCGYHAWCKDCGNAWRREKWNDNSGYRERVKQRRKDAYKLNPRKWDRRAKNHSLKRDYGITVEDYEAILASQGGKCGLCGGGNNQKGRDLHVDHCHETGIVRGILCHACNTQLGIFEKFRKKFTFEKVNAWLGRNALGK